MNRVFARRVVAVVAALVLAASVVPEARGEAVVPVEAPTSPAYPPNAIMVNPVALVLGAAFGMWSLRFEYERRLLPWLGLAVQPSFMHWSFGDLKVTGGGVILGAPMFPGSSSIRGFFIKPQLGLEYARGSYESDSGGLGVFSIGATIGYTWQWQSGFIMSLEGGAAFPVLFGDLVSDVTLPLKVMPMLNYWIGWSF